MSFVSNLRRSTINLEPLKPSTINAWGVSWNISQKSRRKQRHSRNIQIMTTQIWHKTWLVKSLSMQVFLLCLFTLYWFVFIFVIFCHFSLICPQVIFHFEPFFISISAKKLPEVGGFYLSTSGEKKIMCIKAWCSSRIYLIKRKTIYNTLSEQFHNQTSKLLKLLNNMNAT